MGLLRRPMTSIIITITVISLYFYAALLALWWTVSLTRKRRNDDLRYHRNLLLERIHSELIDQERRLADRLRPLK